MLKFKNTIFSVKKRVFYYKKSLSMHTFRTCNIAFILVYSMQSIFMLLKGRLTFNFYQAQSIFKIFAERTAL